MKKVLSFVLVLAMILGSVSMAFAADPALPFEDAPNSKLATVLRDLNVLKGSDGKVFLETPVSRAEICAILMRVLGYEDYCTADYAINAASSFSDVVPGIWYNGYVNVAAQLGYVDGVGGGKFNPLGNVGLNDGVAFVMKALGYSAEHLLLDWPYNFLVPAQTMGLLEGVDTKAAELTRKDMFTILYNALEEPLVKWVYTNPVKPELGGKFDPVTKDPGTFDTFAELASGKKNLAELKNIYATGYAVIAKDYSTQIANEDLDLDEYVGQNVIVLSKGGLILAVLGKDSKTTTEIEYNKSKAATTIAGLAISNSAVTKIFRNGEELSKNDHDAIELASAVALSKNTDWTVEYTTAKDAKKVEKVDSIVSVSYDVIDGYVLVSKAQAASFAALATNTSILAGHSFKLSGSSILTKVQGAASSVDGILEGDVLELYSVSGGAIEVINVVRDDVTGVKLTMISADDEFTFDNGKTYELASKVFDAPNDSLKHATLKWVSPMALKLNSEGEIVYATLEGINEAPVVKTTAYGIVVYQYSKAAHSYTADGEKITTNNAMSIMPFGATEALVFENVSVAGLAGRDAWTKKATEGALVEYSVSADGKLTAITASSLGFEDELYVKNGKIDNKYIASGVEIIKTTAEGASSNAAAYGVYTLADIEGQTVSAVVSMNALGTAVDRIIVRKINDAVAPTTKSYVSPAALLSWEGVDKNGTIVSYFDGEVKEAHATAGATGIDPVLPTTTITGIYTVEFDKTTGKITSVEAFTLAEQIKVADVTVSGITVSAVAGGVEAVRFTGGSNPIYVDAPTVWVLTAKGFVAGTEDTLQKNINKYYTESISIFKVGKVAENNFVVIK